MNKLLLAFSIVLGFCGNTSSPQVVVFDEVNLEYGVYSICDKLKKHKSFLQKEMVHIHEKINETHWAKYSDKYVDAKKGLELLFYEKSLVQITIKHPCMDTTSRGIHIGSSREMVELKYGKPLFIMEPYQLEYNHIGFRLQNGIVFTIYMSNEEDSSCGRIH